MRRLTFALTCGLIGAAGAIAPAQTSLPRDKGLPVQVKVAVAFVELVSFKENTGTFNGTVDVRLRWQDLRLRRPPEEATDPRKVYRGADAQAQAARIWVPNAEIANQRGAPSYD